MVAFVRRPASDKHLQTDSHFIRKWGCARGKYFQQRVVQKSKDLLIDLTEMMRITKNDERAIPAKMSGMARHPGNQA